MNKCFISVDPDLVILLIGAYIYAEAIIAFINIFYEIHNVQEGEECRKNS